MKNEPDFLTELQLQIWRQLKAKLTRDRAWEDMLFESLETCALAIGGYIEKRRRVKAGDPSAELAQEAEIYRMTSRHSLRDFGLLDEKYIPVAELTAAGDDADIARLFPWAFQSYA